MHTITKKIYDYEWRRCAPSAEWVPPDDNGCPSGWARRAFGDRCRRRSFMRVGLGARAVRNRALGLRGDALVFSPAAGATLDNPMVHRECVAHHWLLVCRASVRIAEAWDSGIRTITSNSKQSPNNKLRLYNASSLWEIEGIDTLYYADVTHAYTPR